MARRLGKKMAEGAGSDCDPPVYSSYDTDKRSISMLIVWIRQLKRTDGTALVKSIDKKELRKINRLDRWRWYKEAAESGLFPLPENRIFQRYSEIYEEIKKRYKERRKTMLTKNYWLYCFYQKRGNGYILKPKDEVIEILRGLIGPVFEDIEKKIFHETEQQKRLRIFVLDYLNSGKAYIPRSEFLDMLKKAGYSNYPNCSESRLLRGLRMRLGFDIRVLSRSEELRFLLERELKSYSKKFGNTITRGELVKISERIGYSTSTFSKASFTQLRKMCRLLEGEIRLVRPEERRGKSFDFNDRVVPQTAHR